MSERKQRKMQQAVKQATFLFDKLPNKCTGCTKPFDKHSKEAATEWAVNVYKESEKVCVYCPDCWKDVQAWAQDFQKDNGNV
jgi:uncharacterized protein with PIN domain